MFKLLFLAAAFAAAAPIPAFSQIAAEIHVQHADLDLTTFAGQSKLDRRIAAATAKFCPDLDNAELSRRAAAERCQRRLTASVAVQRNRVIAAAAGQRDVAALTAVRSTSRTD